ncbi:hypothetical protein FRX31_022285 [Thalictrum thalictroides]|uniref:BED-type domain-containing protein n=1 Tax=Thalictrum thalictroides TaxID=46969 RepID=A0A7J6VU65_THATH|nr:hypothetical protein FRX31_022285 [Thalictrum thalictroides]
MATENTTSNNGSANIVLEYQVKDIAWQWGERRDPNNYNKVTCKLCNKQMLVGEISRLKEHLVHKKGNVTGCPVKLEIQKKNRDSLQEFRKKKVEKARVEHILQRQDEDVDISDDDVIEVDGGNNIQRSQGVVIGKKRKGVDNVRGPLDKLMSVDIDKIN